MIRIDHFSRLSSALIALQAVIQRFRILRRMKGLKVSCVFNDNSSKTITNSQASL